MKRIFEIQRNDFLQNGPLTLVQRLRIISKLIDILVDNRNLICDCLNADFGNRSPLTTALADIAAAVGALKHARSHLSKWMRSKNVATTPFVLSLFGASAKIEYQAKGVVGIISPWNFPINLCFGPLASVIAAGNRAMIKPSEFTPLTSSLIADLIVSNFAVEEIAVINGGDEVGREFSTLAFDHLVFTGATAIGKKIMAAASENLTPITLELGGKSPCIIDDDFDMKLAAQRIISGKFMNAGQVCLAPDYLFVKETKLNEFIIHLKDEIGKQYPTIMDNAEYCSIINDRHFLRLRNYIDEAIDMGAKVIAINPSNEDIDTNSRKLLPHFVINPNDDLKLMNEEIFGPILPIKTYNEISEVIEYINQKARPLALYYFGKNKKTQNQILSKTISGGVTINDVILHVAMEELPFGGIGASGMGAYHGHRGFLEFSHQKAIFKQSAFDNFLLKATRPPFGKVLEQYLNFTIKK